MDNLRLTYESGIVFHAAGFAVLHLQESIPESAAKLVDICEQPHKWSSLFRIRWGEPRSCGLFYPAAHTRPE